MLKNIPINKIIVGERFRKDFGNIDELATSIKIKGLLHPIVVDEKYNLIAGERRYKAHIQLGFSTIMVNIMSGLDELEKKEIEIEENIKRKSFTWQEECYGLKAIQELKQSIFGAKVSGHAMENGWGVSDTANELNISVGKVSIDIALAKALELYPELSKCSCKADAIKLLKDKGRKETMIVFPTVINTNNILRNVDCQLGLKLLDNESIDFILTDPPYGINIDKAQEYKNRYDNVYSDVPMEIENLLDLVFRDCYRVLKEDKIAIFFYPIQKYEWTKRLLERVGFEVFSCPIIWTKGGGFPYASTLTLPVINYETMLFCRKGKSKLNTSLLTHYVIPSVTSNLKIHPLERPLQLLRIFIESCSNPGDIVLDCFAGSGSTLIASLELNRNVIGFEKDITYFTDTTERINKHVQKIKGEK